LHHRKQRTVQARGATLLDLFEQLMTQGANAMTIVQLLLIPISILLLLCQLIPSLYTTKTATKSYNGDEELDLIYPNSGFEIGDPTPDFDPLVEREGNENTRSSVSATNSI
jgi:hypothetical protein